MKNEPNNTHIPLAFLQQIAWLFVMNIRYMEMTHPNFKVLQSMEKLKITYLNGTVS